MPTFVNPLLLWGLVILGVPILIHLINLMRHRRIEWAAMEFLLESQKKNSTSIRLKELVLLLLRLSAIAAVVLILAQPLLQSQIGRLFGGVKTHHVVLWDDSFSMSDRWADTSAFDEARRVIERLGHEAARQPTMQSFSLLRFSRAARGTGGTQPDFLEEKVDTRFDQKLRETLRSIGPSELAVGPGRPLEVIEQLLGESGGEHRIVYLVSDFRAREWEEPGEVAKSLARLNRSAAEIHLIHCVDAAHANLAVTSLQPQRGTRAAGVPMFMEVTVQNFGGEKAKSVSIMLVEDGNARPAIEMDEIGAGESETRRFQVFFSTAGEHLVAARLESDPVAADNVRYRLVDLPLSVPVLLVDGDPDMLDARFLAAALAPGGAVKTGIDPRIESPSFLNANPLDKFKAVYLLDVGRLDQPAIDALETYVREGGGLGIFLGERCPVSFYNDKLYRDGEGLFPLPLVGKTQLLVDRLETGADLAPTDHPIFKVFAGERNSFLNAVLVDWYMSAPKGFAPPSDSTTSVIARLRNGAPLAVERKFGAGRVVALLTSAAPVWNNWARNPSFVLTALEMQSYLASPETTHANRLVGSPIEVQLDPARYQPRVQFVSPLAGEAGLVPGTAATGPAGLTATLGETGTSGVYELRLTTRENKQEMRRWALNVEADEGDLATVGGEELASRLEGIDYTYRQARDFHFAPRELAGSNVSDWILYLLLVALVGEQVLAYSATYHPPAKGGAR